MEERIMAIVYREISKMEEDQAKEEVGTLVDTLTTLLEGL